MLSALDPRDRQQPPVLAVDVDGVISLFGFTEPFEKPPGRYQLVDGIPHCISLEAGPRLMRLADRFELVWATGWEEKANEYLPSLLGLPTLPTLRFGPDARFGTAHWKLGPIGEYARGRPLAWIDDSFSHECFEWAAARPEPTLLVHTRPDTGILDAHVEALTAWIDDGFADRPRSAR